MSALPPKSSLFSQYQTVTELQLGMREMSTALFDGIKTTLGSDRTHVYGLLSICSGLVKVAKELSAENKKFALEVVAPAVDQCFKAIAEANDDFNNIKLKTSLEQLLDKAVLLHPKPTQFQLVTDDASLKELAAQNLQTIEATYELCDIIPESNKFRNAFLTIPQVAFSKIIDICKTAGHMHAGDKISSTASGVGHITLLPTPILAANYESVIKGHSEFTKKTPKVSITVEGIKIGMPQTGRLARVFMLAIKVDLQPYLNAVGLGTLKLFPPCMTIFSSEVQAHSKVKGMALRAFANLIGSELGLNLAERIEAYAKKIASKSASVASVETASKENSK